MPMNNTTFFTILLLFLRFNLFSGQSTTTGKLPMIPGLYVFGDSLVDAGNNNYLTVSVVKANYAHNGVDFPDKKATGRFSNGKTAADFIAEKFGLPLLPPYLSLKRLFKEEQRKSAALLGVNFASSAAGIFNSSDLRLRQAIPLSIQVNNWLEIHKDITNQLKPAEAEARLSKSLFFVGFGSNDIFDYYNSIELRQQTNPQNFTQTMADKLKEQLKRIYETGARRFLLPGIAQIGCTPSKRIKNSTIHECDEETNMWCSMYNDKLVKVLQQLKRELKDSITYTYFDNYSSSRDIVANPARYGFSDVKSACCGNGKILNAEVPCSPFANLCTDRSKYVFWDRFGHPTEAAARTFVDLMLNDDDLRYSSPITFTQLVST